LLSELAEKAASLSDVALRLASSTDAWWRHVFVGFCMNTQVADREILVALAKLLDDPDLRVRSQVIKWIAVVPEGLVEALWGVAFPLQGFSPRVLLGHQSKTMWRDRSHRAFRIGIEIKAGHKVEDIEDQALYEDNYTFDWLLAGNMKIRPITFSS
jgi:hypothetical protein